MTRCPHCTLPVDPNDQENIAMCDEYYHGHCYRAIMKEVETKPLMPQAMQLPLFAHDAGCYPETFYPDDDH